MRSRLNFNLSRKELQQLYQQALEEDLLFEDFGPKTTVFRLALILALAVSLSLSLAAAANKAGLSPQGFYNALNDNLPVRAATLEKRLVHAFGRWLSRRLRRRAWVMAIDFHLIDYYGEPAKHKKELYRSQAKRGTSDYHAYATICIVDQGCSFTLALTWVRAREKPTVVIDRLLRAVAEEGFCIRRLLLDRGFYSVAVIHLLQARGLPFIMPVVLRGRQPQAAAKVQGRKGKQARRQGNSHGAQGKQARRAGKGSGGGPRHVQSLRALLDRASGWYQYTMKKRQGTEITFDVCVSSRWYIHHRTKKRCRQKLLYATWQIQGQPCEIRDQYRKRFVIETSYRQLEQGRIRTCTRDPIVRLFLVGLALLLRNLWVWLRQQIAQSYPGRGLTRRLKKVTFAAMLQIIVGLAWTGLGNAAEGEYFKLLAIPEVLGIT